MAGPLWAAGQESRARSVDTASRAATPGEMIRLVVLDRVKIEAGSEGRFQVDILQDGRNRPARVGNVSITPVATGDASVWSGHVITFTVPRDLTEGEAAAIVSYAGSEVTRFTIAISDHPYAPRILTAGDLSSPKEGAVDLLAPGDDPAPENLRLERGKEATLHVYPLVDPEDDESGILVRFKQGSYDREVKAQVVQRGESARYESNSQTGIYESRMTLNLSRFEARVGVPGDLTPGAAEIDVRVRANGAISEPSRVAATIVDAGGLTTGATPRIISLTPGRIGIGQAATVVVADIPPSAPIRRKSS